MKTFLFLLLAASALLPARAQTLTADWAVQCATKGRPYSLVVDAQGNSYVAGTFSGTTTLGTTTLTATQAYGSNTGPRDVFLAKLNPQGQYQWAMQFNDGQDGGAYVGAVDNLGNLYVSGSFTSYSFKLGSSGPTLYNSSSQSEGFVACFSTQTGQCQWARRFGGTGDDYAGLPVFNANGDVFLTGDIGGGDADFGPYTLPAAPTFFVSRPFLAKLSAAGTWLWARQVGTSPDSYGSAGVGRPLLDGLGNLFLTGRFSTPSLTLGPTTLTTTIVPSQGQGADLFIAKYTESGVLRWARQASPGGNNSLSGSAIYDGQGHLFFAGGFDSQTARLGPLTLTNAGPLVPQPSPAPPTPNTTRYYNDGFVARYDTAGIWDWATRRGGYTTSDEMALPTFDSTGRLFALYSSDYGVPFRLVPINPTTGAFGSDFSLPFGTYLTNDQLGRLYVYGSFTGASLNLGGQTIVGAGGNTATGYVARLGNLTLTAHPAAPAGAGLHAWPTPGPSTGVWIQGAPLGQAVEVFDMLGRRVGGGTMPASGPLRLNWAGTGLAPGVYIIRSSEQSCRWVVE